MFFEEKMIPKENIRYFNDGFLESVYRIVRKFGLQSFCSGNLGIRAWKQCSVSYVY